MNQQKLEKLMADHAYWSDERKRLKAEGSEQAEKCTRLEFDNSGIFLTGTGENCIASIYSSWKDACDEEGFWSEPSFEEIWDEAVLECDVCEHCQNVRALKKQRMDAGRRLGNVRAAITRVGRRIQREQSA